MKHRPTRRQVRETSNTMTSKSTGQYKVSKKINRPYRPTQQQEETDRKSVV